MTTTNDLRDALAHLAEQSEAYMNSARGNETTLSRSSDAGADVVELATQSVRRRRQPPRWVAASIAAAAVVVGVIVWATETSHSRPASDPAASRIVWSWPLRTLPFAVRSDNVSITGIDSNNRLVGENNNGSYYSQHVTLTSRGHALSLELFDHQSLARPSHSFSTAGTAPVQLGTTTAHFGCLTPANHPIQPTQCQGGELGWTVRDGTIVAELALPSALPHHRNLAILSAVARNLDFSKTTAVRVPFSIPALPGQFALEELNVQTTFATARIAPDPLTPEGRRTTKPEDAVVVRYYPNPENDAGEFLTVGLARLPLPPDGYLGGRKVTLNDGRDGLWVASASQPVLYIAQPNGTLLMIAVDNPDNLNSLDAIAAFANTIRITSDAPDRSGWYDAGQALP